MTFTCAAAGFFVFACTAPDPVPAVARFFETAAWSDTRLRTRPRRGASCVWRTRNSGLCPSRRHADPWGPRTGRRKGAEQFFDRGVLGLVCVLLILTIIVLGVVIRALDKRLTKLNADALTDRERLITAIEAGETAVEGLTDGMRGVQTTRETRGRTVGELSHQIRTPRPGGQPQAGQPELSRLDDRRRHTPRRDKGRPMKWWRRIMLIFNWHSDGQEASERVEAPFARYDSAQHRAGSAGRDVERVADAQTSRLKIDQGVVRERIARQQPAVHSS